MIEETLRIASDGLDLEGRFSYFDDAVAPPAGAMICPPHPFLGGDLDNNVITAIGEALVRHGIPVFRYNYRGIGKSESNRDLNRDLEQFWESSTCPEYEAEIMIDSVCAYTEFSRLLPAPLPLYVVGYSFGALSAVRVAQSVRVTKLCLVSPPLAKWPINPPQREIESGVFYAPGDFACPSEAVYRLFDSIPQPKTLRAFDDGDHFFVGQEQALATAVCEFLTK